MADLKTKPNDLRVDRFLNNLTDKQTRQDCLELLEIMKHATRAEPKMWGDSTVGFGSYHYKYETGREGDWFLTGFSPRKQNLTLYIMGGFERYYDLLNDLGQHKTGKSCLYIKRLDDVHKPTLKRLINQSVKHMKAVK